MPAPVIPSGIADLHTTQAMAAEYLSLLADRDGSVLTHPALLHATGLVGSNVVRVAHIGLGGYNLLAATTPGSEVDDTALADSSTDVTVAMCAKRYTVDDFARFMANGKLDPIAFAQDAGISVAQTLISKVATVGATFTGVSGTASADANWEDVIDAKSTLGAAKAQGAICAILKPKQWFDLEADALSLGALPAMTMGGVINTGLGSAYKGNYMGVDWYVSDHVPEGDATTSYTGCMFTLGGIAWADVQLAAENDPNIVDLGRARFERVRRGTYLNTAWMTSYGVGVAKAIDGAGIVFKSKKA